MPGHDRVPLFAPLLAHPGPRHCRIASRIVRGVRTVACPRKRPGRRGLEVNGESRPRLTGWVQVRVLPRPPTDQWLCGAGKEDPRLGFRTKPVSFEDDSVPA